MFSTRQVLALLREANPGRNLTEDGIRNAIRRGRIREPDRFAGRLIWSRHDIEELAAVLRLKTPSPNLQPEYYS